LKGGGTPDRHRSQGRDRDRDWLDYIGLILSALTFFAALGAAVFTGFAAYYTSKQWATALDTERRQLRAHVLFGEAFVTVAGTKLKAAVAVKNSGQTPAYSLTDWWAMKISPNIDNPYGKDGSRPLPLEETGAESVDIGSGRVQTLYPAAKTIDITSDELEAVRAGRLFVYLWGIVKYRDVFQRCQLAAFFAKNQPDFSTVDRSYLALVFHTAIDVEAGAQCGPGHSGAEKAVGVPR
jgi:hypothetical protein